MKRLRLISIILILASILALTSCCFVPMRVLTDIFSPDTQEVETNDIKTEKTSEETQESSSAITESESESISESESESVTEKTETSESESEIETEPQYKSTTLPFVAHCDFIGDETVGKSVHSKSANKCTLKGYETDRSSLLRVSGWCIIEGGVSKYVWSMDGGKTWYDIDGTRNYGSSAMLQAAESTLNYTFESELTVVNAHFQGCGTLVIDLYDYQGETLNIIIGAVPMEDESSVAILFYLPNFKCN